MSSWVMRRMREVGSDEEEAEEEEGVMEEERRSVWLGSSRILSRTRRNTAIVVARVWVCVCACAVSFVFTVVLLLVFLTLAEGDTSPRDADIRLRRIEDACDGEPATVSAAGLLSLLFRIDTTPT